MPLSEDDKFTDRVFFAALEQLEGEKPLVRQRITRELQSILNHLIPNIPVPNDPLLTNDPQILARELIRSIRSTQ